MADEIKPAPRAQSDDLLVPDFAKVPQVGSNIYDLQYFSGTQAALYIGDVYVDEVTSFSYSVSQSKTPIFGYASQLFDAVSHGNVLVQGQFTVNFKEAGYLWLVLHRYKRFENTVDAVLAKYVSANDTTSTASVALKRLGSGTRALGGKNVPFARIKNKGKEFDFISRAGIERLVNGSATRDERFDFYQSLAGYATVSNPNNQDTAFEDITRAFEEQVWQEDVSDVDDQARRVDDNFFDDFDMFLVFGDYTKPGAHHTVRRIRGVHLLGQAQTVENNGENVFENYSFMARNII